MEKTSQGNKKGSVARNVWRQERRGWHPAKIYLFECDELDFIESLCRDCW